MTACDGMSMAEAHALTLERERALECCDRCGERHGNYGEEKAFRAAPDDPNYWICEDCREALYQSCEKCSREVPIADIEDEECAKCRECVEAEDA